MHNLGRAVRISESREPILIFMGKEMPDHCKSLKAGVLLRHFALGQAKD